jgi:hypothetical protein
VIKEDERNKFRDLIANKKKISEIQEILLNKATMMVAYPDASADDSDMWDWQVSACRVELRRRWQATHPLPTVIPKEIAR